MYLNQHSEALYHALWDHALIGVALVREDGAFVAANPAFCKLTEYTEAELRTKKYQEMTHPDDAAYDQVMAGELLLGTIGGYDMPKRYLTKFGRVINIMSRVAAIREGEQGRERFVCFLSQIAPLSEQQIHASPSKPHPPAARKLFWKQIKSYWPMITFALGLIASVVVQVLQQM